MTDLLAALPGRTLSAISIHVKVLRIKGHQHFWRQHRRLVNLPDLHYTPAEKAWLACAIDCEGTISIDHNHGKFLHPYIFFGNSNQAIVERFHQLSRAPVTVFVMRYTDPRGRNWKDQWHVKVRQTRWVYVFLREIQDYLVIKKRHAERVLRFMRIHDERLERGLSGYTDEQWLIKKEIQTLNHRGRA